MTTSALPVFIGTYADSIRLADFDPATGALRDERAVASLAKASFLAKSADGRFLYAVEENGAGAVHAFAIGETGQLTRLNTRPSEGAAPCDLSLSPDGRLLAVANYTGGSVIVYRLEHDGSLGEKAAFFQHTHASNVFANRQKTPHAHGVTWTPDGRLLLVPDLGGDRVYLYACEPETGALAPHAAQAWLDIPAGAGPRHAQFSPDLRHLYVVNELGNSVTVAAFDSARRTLAVVETVSTLPPEGFSGKTSCAEIAVHPAGHTVYASNRGADTIAVFSRDAATGRLRFRDHVAVPANPRHFTLSPDARWLLSAGQNADRVDVFAVDAASGGLSPTSTTLALGKPVCLRF